MSIGDKAGCGFDELGVIEEGTHPRHPVDRPRTTPFGAGGVSVPRPGSEGGNGCRSCSQHHTRRITETGQGGTGSSGC
jgi:hypothetical protein